MLTIRRAAVDFRAGIHSLLLLSPSMLSLIPRPFSSARASVLLLRISPSRISISRSFVSVSRSVVPFTRSRRVFFSGSVFFIVGSRISFHRSMIFLHFSFLSFRRSFFPFASSPSSSSFCFSLVGLVHCRVGDCMKSTQFLQLISYDRKN